MKKFKTILLLAMTIILSLMLFACDSSNSNHIKQIPVYTGMVIMGSYNSELMTKGEAGCVNSDSKSSSIYGDTYDRFDNLDPNRPFDGSNGLSIEEKTKETLNIVSSGESIYYTDKNKDIYITIKLSNPDCYEILSFTLNGKKYSNYMFEKGSDMENLVLKVNVGDVGGILDYNIDAIKYIDGDEIKDVRMFGDKTVKVGVKTNNQMDVNIANEQTTITSISFDVKIVDLYSLVEKSGGYAKAVLYDGVNISIKDIAVNEKNSIVFDNLSPNTIYQYGIVALYDDLNGSGVCLNTLYKKVVHTDAIVLFKDVQVGQESISWSFEWNEMIANKQISTISLWQNDVKIQDIDIDSTYLNGLQSGKEYSLKATYNSVDNQVETIQLVFTTQIKNCPIVRVVNMHSSKTTIEFDIEYIDDDSVGNIIEVALYDKNDRIGLAQCSEHILFAELEPGKEYQIVIKYQYDLNDGNGVQTTEISNTYSTLLDSIVVDELILLNNSVVKLGEELNLRVYFANNAKIELTGIYVNGKKATVVGGDRIESAIIKFVPETSGLCKFAIDRVDYVINGVEVNQEIDEIVEVEYPIYKDLSIAYTPITCSKYENTGDGVYINFDNIDGYTVFKVNGHDRFVVVGNGKIYTQDNSITSIEYGYDNYGHTTQNCDYTVNNIHGVGEFVRIYTVEQFFNMKSGGYYILMNDLDLRNYIIEETICFSVLDANGHTIRGLSNVIDTSKNEYFDLFWSGSIYDAKFTELYFSINSESEISVCPLGNAELYNCTIEGDILLSKCVNMKEFCIANESTTYNINVTKGDIVTTKKQKAVNLLEKNQHIVERNGALYFDCVEGKAFLAYLNEESSQYSVEDETFFVRAYAFASQTFSEIYFPVSVEMYGNHVFWNSDVEKLTCANSLNLYEIPKSVKTLTLYGIDDSDIAGKIMFGLTNSFSTLLPNLISITLGDGFTDILHCAFGGHKYLENIVISSSIQCIHAKAFMGCKESQDIRFLGTIEQWNAIEKEEDWNASSGDFVIHCLDGDVNKEGIKI